MRFKMIGYGRFHFTVTSGERVRLAGDTADADNPVRYTQGA
jgi:hypothetical protein